VGGVKFCDEEVRGKGFKMKRGVYKESRRGITR